MKLKSITIRRTEAYATPANTLVGTIDLLDAQGGAVTIVLSPMTIVKFAQLVSEEVTAKAQAQAKLIPLALAEARAELEIQANPLLTDES